MASNMATIFVTTMMMNLAFAYAMMSIGGLYKKICLVYFKIEIHSNLDIANMSVRHFLFTILNNSLYQM